MKRKKKKQSSFGHQLLIAGGILSLFGILYVVITTTSYYPCANSISCEESMNLKVENGAKGVFQNRSVPVPPIDLSQKEHETSVLGTSESTAEKHIYVDLATQTLLAYEGEKLFMKTLISSGLWGRTPKGEFRIWTKIRSSRMTGGSGDDFYDLPNVPYVMFFSNNEVAASRGFSLHGTYWHNNFGHPMSHGCVNMKTTDVAKLFEWADDDPGTKITIFDSTEI